MTTITTFVLKMEVNKKEAGEYKLIGSVDVPVFALADFGLSAIPSGQDAEGLPTYDNPAIQYVQDAITASIKAAARNKLVSGTIVMKAGNKIASTVAELMESNQNSGAALALHREFIAAFVLFLTTSGKSTVVQALYAGLVKAKSSISLASAARRIGLSTQLENFLASANATDQNKYLGILEGLSSLCEDATDLDDSDL